MGNTDSIPAVSQIKSGVQFVCGDTEGATRTQENFFRECPVVSQVTSAVQVLAGDTDGAIETQKRCGKGLMKMADGVPVVGHVKGIVHYACGDTEGGHQAMKSATRTTGVIAGGAGGFIVGGPAGAVAGGIYGGAVMDTSTTIITQKPTGYVAAIGNAIENPNPGDLFDLAMMPVADGLAGYSGGKIVDKLQKNAIVQNNIKTGKVLEAQGQALLEATEAKLEANPNMPNGEYMNGMNKAQKLFSEGRKLQGDNPIPYDQVKLKPQQTTTVPKSGSSSATVVTSVRRDETRTEERKEEKEKQKRRNNEASSQKRTRPTRADSESDDECICTELKLPVLYVNMGSINPRNRSQSMKNKIDRFKALINIHRPRLIAIVETWLTSAHTNEEVCNFIGLSGYEISRHDREDGHDEENAYGQVGGEDMDLRGGGILVAWKNDGFTIEHFPPEDYADNIVNFDIIRAVKCRKCAGPLERKRFAFTVVYRRPQPFNQEVYDRLVHIPSWFLHWEDLPYSGWAMVGDFNWGERKQAWLDSLLLNACGTGEVVRLSQNSTHKKGQALDQVIAKTGFVDGSVVTVTELVSDHSALVFNLKLGKDSPPDQDCNARECS